MRVKDNLNKQFGVQEVVDAEYRELPAVRGSTLPAVVDPSLTPKKILDPHMEDDVNMAREAIVDVLSRSTDILDEAINLAKESQDPKAIDSTTNLLMTIAKLSEKLMNFHAPEKSARGKPAEAPVQQENTQTNIFVGTTDELQNMIANMKSKPRK